MLPKRAIEEHTPMLVFLLGNETTLKAAFKPRLIGLVH